MSNSPDKPAPERTTLPATGVDLVEVARIRQLVNRSGQAALDRLYSPDEQAYCQSQADPAPHLAARFAAKEAIAKALGCGIGALAAWAEIEVIRCPGGQPTAQLHGTAAATARRLGVRHISLSLSHTRDHAIASVILA